ncbi:kininogen-1 isoform X1 [Diceros bicornis minor]|uniref:kininogen-1 isoform X1 n=1 Tax=Diceros bicornis minor TaxID=77932 RepID=UPI0026EE2DF9|nr:kininogen-1 isoform X1 [Diceros bicornis minor]
MKLIAIIFLCSRLLLSVTQESLQEIDCNDEDVFKAVDTALKKYNNGKQSGYQFVLYRVMEVTKTDDPDTFYSFKYQIKEGDCPVGNGTTWQDCDYKDSEQAATGECTATIRKSEDMRFSVATQTCQITPAEGPVVTAQYECLGCLHPISTASPDLEPVLRHAVQYFNNNTGHSHLFALREVKKAQRQVVAGWNYDITYSVVQTNCSKANFLFLTPDCKSLLNGDIGECTGKAQVDIQLRVASFSQNCNLLPGEDFVQPPSRICAGCPIDIPVNSTELEEPLNHSIAKLNAENNGTFYFKIDIVKKAKAQVVAGMKYFIEFTARETTCSKERNDELTDSCEIHKSGQILDCKAVVYVIPWEKKIYPTVNCQSLQTISLLKRPPGFSPFRAAQVVETKEGTTVSPLHTSVAPVQDEEQDSGKEQGPTRGHGRGHGKQIKHGLGHGYKHEHDQGPGHQRGHGLGHGHQKQHGLGHGHQQKINYGLEHQGTHGLGHGHKREHGRGHVKHKNKGKNKGKHNGWKTEHLASSSEDSTTSSAQTQEESEGPTPLPSLAQPGVAVTFPDFQDSALFATVMTNTPLAPTDSDDDWIPDVQIEPNSLSFNLISDFPETTPPKCPGRPWKPVDRMNPTVESKEFHDFSLSDALN